MAKSATKKKPAKQPDLFDMPRTAKSSARKGPKTSARAKTSARSKSVGRGSSAEAGYTAKHIEVLEGLEPVRRRPGMYIGGTDEKALHHLFAEVIDNSMDEALAGHADWIDVKMAADGFVTVVDNGRGMPADPKIFGPKAAFKAARIFKMARSKAYLFGGVEIRWSCDKALLAGVEDVPEQETFHFERGLTDFLDATLHGTTLIH